MLKLPGALQEDAVTAELVVKVLDEKLADRPTAIVVVLMDLLAKFMLLVVYLDAVSKRAELRSAPQRQSWPLFQFSTPTFSCEKHFKFTPCSSSGCRGNTGPTFGI